MCPETYVSSTSQNSKVSALGTHAYVSVWAAPYALRLLALLMVLAASAAVRRRSLTARARKPVAASPALPLPLLMLLVLACGAGSCCGERPVPAGRVSAVPPKACCGARTAASVAPLSTTSATVSEPCSSAPAPAHLVDPVLAYHTWCCQAVDPKLESAYRLL